MASCAFLSSARLCVQYGIDRSSWGQVICGRFFDGIVVSDSFLTGKRFNMDAHRYALERWLLSIRRTHGKNYIFVLCSGGGFAYGDFGDFGVFLAENMKPPYDFLWIAMGNDLYRKSVDVDVDALCVKITDRMNRVGKVAQRQMLIFGGSATIWRYAESFDDRYAAWYDENVLKVLSNVGRQKYLALSGRGLLEGLQLVDRIGHVDWRDSSTVECVERFLLHVVDRLGYRVSQL